MNKPPFTLTANSSKTVTQHAYKIRDEKNNQDLTYIETVNDYDNVIDCLIRDENGVEIQDPALLEQIQDFIATVDLSSDSL
jgi:hypothetical protein